MKRLLSEISLTCLFHKADIKVMIVIKYKLHQSVSYSTLAALIDVHSVSRSRDKSKRLHKLGFETIFNLFVAREKRKIHI